MDRRRLNLFLNLVGLAVILGVAGYLVYGIGSRVRSVDFDIEPAELRPDGQSEVIVTAQLKSLFGIAPWGRHYARFQIVEGQESGEIIAQEPLAVRLRSKYITGQVVLKVWIEQSIIPYEVIVPVRPGMASAGETLTMLHIFLSQNSA